MKENFRYFIKEPYKLIKKVFCKTSGKIKVIQESFRHGAKL